MGGCDCEVIRLTSTYCYTYRDVSLLKHLGVPGCMLHVDGMRPEGGLGVPCRVSFKIKSIIIFTISLS